MYIYFYLFLDYLNYKYIYIYIYYKKNVLSILKQLTYFIFI